MYVMYNIFTANVRHLSGSLKSIVPDSVGI